MILVSLSSSCLYAMFLTHLLKAICNCCTNDIESFCTHITLSAISFCEWQMDEAGGSRTGNVFRVIKSDFICHGGVRTIKYKGPEAISARGHWHSVSLEVWLLNSWFEVQFTWAWSFNTRLFFFFFPPLFLPPTPFSWLGDSNCDGSVYRHGNTVWPTGGLKQTACPCLPDPGWRILEAFCGNVQ